MKLVVTEKPSVAMNIASVLGVKEKKDGYIEGNDYIISWCIGHLVGYAYPDAYGEEYAGNWTYSSLPIIPDKWKTIVKTDMLKQYKVLETLMTRNDLKSVVCATDAGREGELIFRHVYEKTGCKLPMERLWVSSLEESAIKEGFANLRPGREMDHLYDAAVGRAKADWEVGMNFTRLFSCLYRTKLAVGRVKTPTLAMIVERDKAIQSFVKQPFYTAVLDFGGFHAASDRFDDKKDAEALADSCKGKNAKVVSVESKQNTEKPPLLYDMTSLQRDANRIFGFTAQETLNHTQSLYEKKLCTYPRTDSKYLSEDMEQTALNVLDAVYQTMDADCRVENPNIKRIMDSSKVSDHHAIIPTVEITKNPDMLDAEKKILSLLKMRLVCAVAENHLFTSTKVTLHCENNDFSASGKVINSEGWKRLESILKKAMNGQEEKEKEETQVLPEMTENDEIAVENTLVKEGSTQPPKHFTEDSLLSAMERAGTEDIVEDVERAGLGTTATRAGIIEELIENGYVERQKKNLLATDRGIKLIAVMPDIIISPKMTSDWENKLALIAKGKFQLDDFMEGIEELVRSMVSENSSPLPGHENDFYKPADAPALGECPKCHKPVLSGKYGAYCSGKCGMNLGKAFGVMLSESQLKSLLAGKKTLVRGCKGKEGRTFDAKLKVKGVKSYTDKNGKEQFTFDFDIEFENKKKDK